MITLAKPPHLKLERVADEQDIENFPGPYKLYVNTKQTKKTTTGYPLAMWPAIDAAEFEMCAQRGIATVEQLAAVSNKKNDQPPQIVELVARAKRLVELQKNVGKFEAVIRDLEGQLGAVSAELKEARETIAAQSTIIEQLKPKAAVA
jgi:septal ring factor EnvC (AmiA/AmiB activator)